MATFSFLLIHKTASYNQYLGNSKVDFFLIFQNGARRNKKTIRHPETSPIAPLQLAKTPIYKNSSCITQNFDKNSPRKAKLTRDFVIRDCLLKLIHFSLFSSQAAL
jgi:hypothetical protein